jgi:DNA-binding NarL/FixJ family response regulator
MNDISQIVGTSQVVRIRTAEAEQDTSAPAALADHSLNIGLIDCYRFSQDCLVKAFDGLEPRPAIVPFERVDDCISSIHTKLDVVVYHIHSTDASAQRIVGEVTAMRQAFKAAPIIVLSDAEDAEHPNMIRNVLKYGAQGFIPTRTTGIPIAFAAIQFITAGGVFAPLDLLLTKRPDPTVEAAQRSQLTPRQSAVLNQLQQGKANKIIAHELGMSESTVKVHVRNIMRKTGATNRTQAAYKAQKLWGNRGMSRLVNGDAL